MRVLFIHAARHGLTAEYKVHAVLAAGGAKHGIESRFIWQGAAERQGGVAKWTSAAEGGGAAEGQQDGNVDYFDFGRDYSFKEQPARWRRASMMALGIPRSLPGVLRRVAEFSPDVLYTSQHAFDMRLARAIRQVYPIPHVVHLHYVMTGTWAKDALHQVRGAPLVLAVSEFIRSTALLTGVDPTKVQTLLNTVVEVPAADRERARASLRAQFNWPEAAPVILSAGRLDPSKGHPVLIAAMPGVLARVPGARLLICGETSYRDGFDEKLKQQVKTLGLSEQVTFAGYRNDVPLLLQGADAFCLPTENEPFGLVFLEAMLARLPVIALCSGGVPEVVLDSVTGLLAYPGDRQTLVDHLVAVLSDRALASSLGESGYRRAKERFDPEAAAKKWASLLHGCSSETRFEQRET